MYTLSTIWLSFAQKHTPILWEKTVTMGHEDNHDDEPAAPLPLQEQVHHESRAVTSSYANNMLLGGSWRFTLATPTCARTAFCTVNWKPPLTAVRCSISATPG
jgi:hypothetical protein